jgi:hypothetical protein
LERGKRRFEVERYAGCTLLVLLVRPDRCGAVDDAVESHGDGIGEGAIG